MSTKTISINPTLFSLNGLKTKKNREKKQSTAVPLISPNVLKKKLLKRIKEHKLNENKKLSLNQTNDETINKTNDTYDTHDTHEMSLNNFSDEFSDSINYLQTLSKQKKINDEKNNYEKQKQKRKEELQKNTLKNYQHINDKNTFVNLELPQELKINTEQFISTSLPLNKDTTDTIPYGILKGGIKPTYRNWSKTQRTYPNSSLTINETLEKEKRLQNLREKLKYKHFEEKMQIPTIIQSPTIQSTIPTIQPTIPTIQTSTIQSPTIQTPTIQTSTIQSPTIQSPTIQTSTIQSPTIQSPTIQTSTIQSPTIQNKQDNNIIAIKKIIKRTIKQKYTLGKSKIQKKVGILIKDRASRKRILDAQKELKHNPINNIKTYLRDHNLIKIGSNAPNDIVRKIFESSMLAGDITNSNSETLFHNFSKHDKELF